MSILFVLLLAVLAAALEWLSLEHCLDGLEAEAGISRRAAECGETFTITTAVSSRRRLPVLFLHLTERVPGELDAALEGSGAVRHQVLTHEGMVSTLEQTLYVMPRQKVTRTLTASLPRRGRYVMDELTIQAGDFLGLRERSLQLRVRREIVILPPRADLSAFEPAFGNYLGDMSVRRFILSDPILTAGFREYTGREPQRDIAWPQSLREGRLMVKQYDYTAELTATVMLNVFGGNREEIERCYSLARSVCERLEEKRVTYSFLTNAAVAPESGSWSYLGDGLGPRHLETILEGLGSAEPAYRFTLIRLLEMAGARREAERGFLLVTPPLGRDEMARVWQLERRTGRRVLVLPAAETEAAG